MNRSMLSAAIIALLLTGCAASESTQENPIPSTPEVNTLSTDIPLWVLNPASANGYSASNCVNYSGNFSVDRNHAISLTRNSLAQNMDLKANVLEKTYQKMNSVTGSNISGTSFEQIAKKITSVSIRKSQVEQIALVNIAGVDQVCALVTIPTIETEKVFNNMLDVTSAVDPMDKVALYKEFMSQKTSKELELQIKSLSSNMLL